MPAATVLIPTHNRVEPLRHAIASAQAQTLADFELFVVGDGVGDATRALVTELAAADPRIRFFDFAKGPRKGEVHRHAALAHATGRIVAYLGDDDLWMPMHLATLDALLREVDFGHTMHIGVLGGNRYHFLFADLSNPDFRRRMLERPHNRFDFTFAGHTLQAYRRLPRGWQTTPLEAEWSDLYMWRQFLAEPWCRAASAMVPTCLCTSSHLRPGRGDRERGEELAQLRSRFADPGFREELWRHAVTLLSRESVKVRMAIAQKLDERPDAPG